MTLTEQDLFVAYKTGDTKLVYSDEALTLALADGFHNRLKAHLDLEKIKKYRYLITFTLRDSVKNESWDTVEQYIIKQATRSPLKIIQFYYVRELTKKGQAHWHVAIETTKPLSVDRFNYYKQLYGNIDLSRTKAQKLDECLDYMSKTNTVIKLTL